MDGYFWGAFLAFIMVDSGERDRKFREKSWEVKCSKWPWVQLEPMTTVSGTVARFLGHPTNNKGSTIQGGINTFLLRQGRIAPVLLRETQKKSAITTQKSGIYCCVHVDAYLREIMDEEKVIIQGSVLRKLDDWAFKRQPPWSRRNPNKTHSSNEYICSV